MSWEFVNLSVKWVWIMLRFWGMIAFSCCSCSCFFIICLISLFITEVRKVANGRTWRIYFFHTSSCHSVIACIDQMSFLMSCLLFEVSALPVSVSRWALLSWNESCNDWSQCITFWEMIFLSCISDYKMMINTKDCIEIWKKIKFQLEVKLKYTHKYALWKITA